MSKLLVGLLILSSFSVFAQNNKVYFLKKISSESNLKFKAHKSRPYFRMNKNFNLVGEKIKKINAAKYKESFCSVIKLDKSRFPFEIKQGSEFIFPKKITKDYEDIVFDKDGIYHNYTKIITKLTSSNDGILSNLFGDPREVLLVANIPGKYEELMTFKEALNVLKTVCAGVVKIK